jgi:hypothetical protein
MYTARFSHAAALSVALLSLSACSDGGTDPPGPPSYTATDLGVVVDSLGATARFQATAIREDGVILGRTEGHLLATWTDGTVRMLPRVRGFGNAINAGGEVAGYVVGPPSQPFVYGAGTRTPIEAQGFTGGQARSINADGIVAGYFGQSLTARAFVYDDGGLVVLEVPGYAMSEAQAINDAGDLLLMAGNRECEVFFGVSQCLSPVRHAFRLRDGTATEVPAPVVPLARAGEVELATLRSVIGAAFNASGDVAGGVGTLVCPAPGGTCQFRQRAYVWRGGTAEALDSLAGFANSIAVRMNDEGEIVGRAYNGTGNDDVRIVLWRDGEIFDLSALAQAQGWTLQAVQGINDDGWIVANGTFGGSAELRGVVLRPN